MATETTTSARHHCTPFTLPSNGFISIDSTSTVTLTTDVVFIPDCSPTPLASGSAAAEGISSITDFKDPFHASVTPQAYATGAATVISWMLVIMLLITPRTFFVGGAGGTTGLRGRRGLISGASGGASVIGVGSRPWLQKVAAFSVAISLTIATADTFRVAERQYLSGVMDADDLRDEVVGSTRIKVSRVVSDIFLWLAQIQTLIRLFPRHKEKVLIKWIGFAMIILDATFSCLNTFMSTNSSHDRRFVDAIPALSYLFQLALSMLYAAWVLYYSVTKRRYAFYHKLMWNISLIALLSLIAILTPVVFFITDISNSSVAGWGDYFRWVGAAAASVIVWEWVERIEALEREEKKDGILGREIFDGDEMLDSTPSEEVTWPGRRYGPKDDEGGDGAYASGMNRHGFNLISNRLGRLRNADFFHRNNHEREGLSDTLMPHSNVPAAPTLPAPVASPVSRTDTTSAASTVYAVRYYPAGQPSPPLIRQFTSPPRMEQASQRPPPTPAPPPNPRPRPTMSIRPPQELEKGSGETFEVHVDQPNAIDIGANRHWHVPNPFKRRKALPPPEVRGGQVIEPLSIGEKAKPPAVHNYARWDIKARLGAFAAEQVDRMRDGNGNRQPEDVDLPVTIIPAQPRGRTWSPEDPSMTTHSSISTSGTVQRPSPPIGTIAESLSREVSQTSQEQVPPQGQTSTNATVDLGRAEPISSDVGGPLGSLLSPPSHRPSGESPPSSAGRP
ncbi:PalH-domain-containing protein [Rhizodiscina lignyota]|uniref:PalH-domain-containing protein n=1 Tax=Rhizodiscina lignyota TaxID=1504668 RepID=A0A9P4INV0_9PEZI|nr:PalH-domain-containing protein [Rhizodiscina lignyota]